MNRTPTDQLWKILPSNSTKLEKDLLRTVPFDALLQTAIPAINISKRTVIPDSWLPWLAVEYGLGRLQEFISNPRTLITEGLAFNRLIGTPAAIMQAVSWFNIIAELVEEPAPTIHFAEFQLKLISTLEGADVCKLGRAIDLAKPARGRFRRLFNDAWNVDSFTLDNSDWGDILDNYSGVWGPDVGLCDGRQLWVSIAYSCDLTPPPIYSVTVETGEIVDENNEGISDEFGEAIGYLIIQPGDIGDLVDENNEGISDEFGEAIGYIVDDSIPADFIVAEEVTSAYVTGITDGVILDEEFYEPPSFDSNYLSVIGGCYEEGDLVDELGAVMVDELGEAIRYKLAQ